MADCNNCELSTVCLWCASDTDLVKIKILDYIQQNLSSAEDISERMRWFLTSNLEENKVLEHTLSTEIVLRLEALRELCRN